MRSPHISIVLDVLAITVAAVLLHHIMPTLAYRRAIFPLREAIPELGGHRRVAFPLLEVHREPRPGLAVPQLAHILELLAAGT